MTHDFETVRKMARHLATTLTTLEKPLDNWEWKAHRNVCLGITQAMDVVANTPNASVSQDVLAAFDKRLEEAHEALSDWCERLLNPDAKPRAGDEIAF